MTTEKNEANKRLIEKMDDLEESYGKKTLDQHLGEADSYHAKLVNVNVGNEINFREVLMHKEDQPLIYAISHVPLGRCSNDICSDLLRADIPIGRILKNYKIESRREVNNIFIEKPNEKLQELFKTDEDFLARDYVIINNGEILMWIKEMFPVSYFAEI